MLVQYIQGNALLATACYIPPQNLCQGVTCMVPYMKVGLQNEAGFAQGVLHSFANQSIVNPP